MYTIVGMSGSLRRASPNTGLLRCAETCCKNGDLSSKVRFISTDLSAIPFFNADVEAVGVPPDVQAMVNAVTEADALVLACPEYNYSVAPVLKNALDWASRAPKNAALAGKPVIFFGAGGIMGTSRAQYHLRQVCVRLDLYPLNQPEGFFNAFQGGFEANGSVKDPVIASSIEKMIRALVAVLDKRA